MRFGTAPRMVLACVVLVGVLFLFVFPTQTYVGQRHQIDTAERQLTVLHEQTARLHAEARRLQSDAEVERLARERYSMARPGEEAYAIVPAPATPAPEPAAPVASTGHGAERPAWYARVWRSVTRVL